MVFSYLKRELVAQGCSIYKNSSNVHLWHTQLPKCKLYVNKSYLRNKAKPCTSQHILAGCARCSCQDEEGEIFPTHTLVVQVPPDKTLCPQTLGILPTPYSGHVTVKMGSVFETP